VTVLAAAGGGFLFPVCECAVVPVVRRLVGKGLPLSAAVAYLLGGPIVNPVVGFSTALAYGFDWDVVMLRLGPGYLIAVGVGLAMGRLFPGQTAIPEGPGFPAEEPLSMGCGCQSPGVSVDTGMPFPMAAAGDCGHTACGRGHVHTAPVDWGDRIGAAFNHGMDDFLAVGHYLVIGAFIAALAQTYVDRSLFLKLADLPLVPEGMMMLLAVLLNLCSEADAFIAASFRGLVSVPAQIAFLLTGPMLDLKLLLMYQGLFRPRAIVILASLILGSVLSVTALLAVVHGVSP
jgi:uncharacterized membrane protein YraQ (UPF0718 family)